MIYFILNNNYQYYDFSRHLLDLKNENIALIEIPHLLDDHKNIFPGSYFCYRQNLNKKAILSRVLEVLLIRRKIDREIKPNKNDICIFYTELELLNIYIAKKFYDVGAKVFMIEDGGLATYIPFSIETSEKLTFRDLFKIMFYRLLYSQWGLRLHKVNGHTYFQMPNQQINAVLVYQPVKLKRKVKLYLIFRPVNNISGLLQDRVIFLNSYIYKLYQSKEEYFAGLHKLLNYLSRNYQKILFKFHPAESDCMRQAITINVLNEFCKIEIINNDNAIEEIIDEYKPAVAASHFSAGSFNLLYKGIEPLFLYRLIPQLNTQPIFQQATSILKGLGYNFVSEHELLEQQYSSGLNTRNSNHLKLMLSEIVRQSN